MPLSEPFSGGLDRRTILAELNIFSDGADSSINFTAGSYDGAKNRGLIGGNNSFCGTMANIIGGKAAEFPALPSTVIPSGDISNIYRNGIDGGILVRSGNDFARSADEGATWTDITPAVIVSYQSIQSWRGAQLIYLHSRLSIPDRDYIVSNDNGATFPFTTGFTGIPVAGARNGLLATPDDKLLIAFGGSSGAPSISWTDSADLTSATWNAFDFFALLGARGEVQSVAVNGDASHCVVTTEEGDIVTSLDGLNTWQLFPRETNPFRNAGGIGGDIDNVCFVAQLQGYFITHNAEIGFFIPDQSSLNAGRTISFMTQAAVAPALHSCITDNANLVLPATTNNSLRTLPSE